MSCNNFWTSIYFVEILLNYFVSLNLFSRHWYNWNFLTNIWAITDEAASSFSKITGTIFMEKYAKWLDKPVG